MKEGKKILCKDCPFYSGVQCHGHGDYWAECNFLLANAKSFKRIFNLDVLETIVPKGKDCWAFVVDENSECKVFDIVRY